MVRTPVPPRPGPGPGDWGSSPRQVITLFSRPQSPAQLERSAEQVRPLDTSLSEVEGPSLPGVNGEARGCGAHSLGASGCPCLQGRCEE